MDEPSIHHLFPGSERFFELRLQNIDQEMERLVDMVSAQSEIDGRVIALVTSLADAHRALKLRLAGCAGINRPK